MADDYNGTPLPENQNPEPDDNQNDNIPDWMKEAGWETSQGIFDESKPVFDDLDDEGDEIVPADIPAWLEDAAPDGFSSDPNATPAFEGLDVDEPFITTGDLVPPPSMQPPAEEEQPSRPEEPKKVTDPAEFDIPSWLENLELDEDSQETAVAWLENMPESLRASEEELQAAKEIPAEEPEFIEEPVDELAWVDEIALESEQPASPEADQAALSEDLVASELIPEATEPNQLFEQDEIESMESELPSWLRELGDDEPDKPALEEAESTLPAEELGSTPQSQEDAMPDWLRATEDTDIPEAAESPSSQFEAPARDRGTDIPDWLGEFDDDSPDTSDKDEGLAWLDAYSEEESAAEASSPALAEDREEEVQLEEPGFPDIVPDELLEAEPAAPSEESPQTEGVSPNDETLNAQVPEWLSKLGTGELRELDADVQEKEDKEDDLSLSQTDDDFDTSASWLDQISEEPPETTREEIASQESEVMDWLGDLEGMQDESPEEELDDLRDSLTDISPEVTPPVELESAKYFTEEELAEEDKPDDLPDWLSELREDDDEQALSLEEAIRQTDHDLNDAELDFLSKVDEKQEEDADWLSKLDQVESQPDVKTTTPAVELDPLGTIEEEPIQESMVSGGILERLKDTAEFQDREDVPQWLADIKNEEDPQETAVLWLQQFVNQGGEADIKDEIKRYTDELDPGVAIPKWMEDLKNEEDPQTTAMLWLEKLSANRQDQTAQEPPPSEEDSGWLADLEREAAEVSSFQEAEEVKDFGDPDEGWLADLEIDEKLKTDDGDMPDWSKLEDKHDGPTPEGEPPWMKATSPLEGDFYTDELRGGEEKEVEIPEWLAGYGEGERPEEGQEDDKSDEEEYTWLSAKETPAAAPKSPLDLNKAAISQLEGILGISHQIARGIVSYREKHGPYHDFSDLKNVPEISDEQTIDILKPEVIISEIPLAEEKPPTTAPASIPEPAPLPRKPAKKAALSGNFEEILVTARTRLGDRLINEATEHYGLLIKKKKFLDETIEDLQKASLDYPLEISIQQSLGDAFMQKDMLDEALEAYSKAEDLLP